MKLDNLSVSALFRPLISFVRRFHTLLFFLAVSSSLAIAILVLISIVSLSSLVAPTSDQAVNGIFDKDTIDRIEAGTTPNTQPTGRPSPFIE